MLRPKIGPMVFTNVGESRAVLAPGYSVCINSVWRATPLQRMEIARAWMLSSAITTIVLCALMAGYILL
jgi:hypothetical protein